MSYMLFSLGYVNDGKVLVFNKVGPNFRCDGLYLYCFEAMDWGAIETKEVNKFHFLHFNSLTVMKKNRYNDVMQQCNTIQAEEVVKLLYIGAKDISSFDLNECKSKKFMVLQEPLSALVAEYQSGNLSC
ncbi:hypothetical protein GIB67_004046 [Kingdonia uniflora]|uniref:Uncharacterized protein n=1 Tax=Kingdonia uniflora TaxID=39325 RepID=A0A7J7NRR1_9MAGN|nr:hypothetical protein GIB67_004046 [Kingdonia uniflora]